MPSMIGMFTSIDHEVNALDIQRFQRLVRRSSGKNLPRMFGHHPSYQQAPQRRESPNDVIDEQNITFDGFAHGFIPGQSGRTGRPAARNTPESREQGGQNGGGIFFTRNRPWETLPRPCASRGHEVSQQVGKQTRIDGLKRPDFHHQPDVGRFRLAGF